MSHLGTRTMRILGVAALGSLLVAGTSAAVPAPSVVTTVSGTAVIDGTATNAAGATVQVRTLLYPTGGLPVYADVQSAEIGADGTFSFDLSLAANYFIEFEADARSQPTDSPAAFDTTYAPGGLSFAAIPGSPVTCEITAVPTSTWTRTTTDTGYPYWTGSRSTVSCDQDPTASYTRVYRFWSPLFNHAHFYTADPAESERIWSSDRNWHYEGIAFWTLSANDGQCAGGVPVFRFYSSVFQSHFYTGNATEKAHIIANDRNWAYEGVAYCAFPDAQPGTTAVYRFWSPGFSKHFFTASVVEKDHIVANDRNWTYEGIAYYVTSY